MWAISSYLPAESEPEQEQEIEPEPEACKRKYHVVYIKTHKTGSTTFCSLFWR